MILFFSGVAASAAVIILGALAWAWWATDHINK